MSLTKILFGVLLFVLGCNLAQAVTLPQSDTYSLTLVWNPSPSPEIIGCHLYYGTVSGQYTNTVVVGNVTTVTLSGLLPEVTYFFVITAIDSDGQESDFSNEISYRTELPPNPLPSAQLQIHSTADGQVVLGMTGPAGQTYDIEATEDFTAWTVIGTAIMNPIGVVEFTDPGAADFSQRFYRLHEKQTSPPTLPLAQLQIQGAADGQFLLTVTGAPGQTYAVEATEDFATWIVIGTVTLDDSGTLAFTDADAANFPQRFYRTRLGPS